MGELLNSPLRAEHPLGRCTAMVKTTLFLLVVTVASARAHEDVRTQTAVWTRNITCPNGDFVYVIGQPTIAEDVTYFITTSDCSNGPVLHATAPNGSDLWSHNIPGVYNNLRSLAVSHGVVYVQFDKDTEISIQAIDAATGKQLWNSPLGSYDPSGDRLNDYGGMAVSPDGARLFLSISGSTFFARTVFNSTFLALNSTDGSVQWTMKGLQPSISSPIVRIVSEACVVHFSAGPTVHAMHCGGEIKWQFALSDITGYRISQISDIAVSPLDGTVAVINAGGVKDSFPCTQCILALTQDGTLKPNWPLTATTPPDINDNQRPVFGPDGRLYLSIGNYYNSAASVAALDVHGHTIWHTDLKSGSDLLGSSLSPDGTLLFVATTPQYDTPVNWHYTDRQGIVALNTSNGAVVWAFQPKEAPVFCEAPPKQAKNGCACTKSYNCKSGTCGGPSKHAPTTCQETPSNPGPYLWSIHTSPPAVGAANSQGIYKVVVAARNGENSVAVTMLNGHTGQVSD